MEHEKNVLIAPHFVLYGSTVRPLNLKVIFVSGWIIVHGFFKCVRS